MGRQFMQLADFMIMDTVEHIGEPDFGIDAVVFAGSEEGVDHGGTLGRLVGACEEVIFASDGDGSDDIFHLVIVDFNVVGFSTHLSYLS